MFELNIGNGSIPTSETAVLNSALNTSIQDIIESIKSIADRVVENEGYIGISRQTEIISAKGLKQTISYWKDKFDKLISFLHSKIHNWYDKDDKYLDVIYDMYKDEILDNEDIEDIGLSTKKDDYEL